MRIGIKFRRTGLKKYVSHLDMQRLFGRALRRSGLPVKYSGGFNPHINLSFASALAVGMESFGEYAEFVLVEPKTSEEVFAALAPVLPEGLDLLACGELPEGTKKLMAATQRAAYWIFPETNGDVLIQALETLMSESVHMAVKEKNGKAREFDVRPLLYNVKVVNCETNCVMIETALSGEASLSPVFLLQMIEKEQNAEFGAAIVRQEIFCKKEEEILPLSGLFVNEAAQS